MPPRSMRPDRIVLAQQKKEARPARLTGQPQAIARRARATAETMSNAPRLPRRVLELLPGVRCQCSACVGTRGWWGTQTDAPKLYAFLWNRPVIPHLMARFLGHARHGVLIEAENLKQRASGDVAPGGDSASLSIERVMHSILPLRGFKVLLDAELAALYGVPTKVLLQAVKRNRERFPPDFMLQVTDEEWENLRSQTVTSSAEHGGRRYAPYAFTEQGVAMLSSVLGSSRAIAVNIEIMRAFVRMRELINTNRELAQKLSELERKITTHDQSITAILKAMRELMNPPVPKRRGIGFTANFDES
jgi:hypothetical protein